MSILKPKSIYVGILILALMPLGHKSQDAAAAYNQRSHDLRFISPEILQWLETHAQPFQTSDPSSPLSDLSFLKGMVGDARIVSLGEATHGTREFFRMKHRIFRYLVEKMDFKTFAIEANWPEANRVNHYLQTGEGDPAQFLAGLYFWTWNTQEVLDLILWMRSYNADPANKQPVQFFGFDMQYPEVAMENVITYLTNIDTAAAAEAELLYVQFQSYGPYYPSQYSSAPETIKIQVRREVQAVFDLLQNRRDDFITAAGVKAFTYTLQNARIVIQTEDCFSGRNTETNLRDFYMAENVTWILDQACSGGKIMLWAHNGHVGTNTYTNGSMGDFLRQKYEKEMIILGFNFFTGSFNAVLLQNGCNFGLREHFAVPPPENTYEYLFWSLGKPRLMLDLRGHNFNTNATSWVKGPRLFRRIGAAYQPTLPYYYFWHSRLTQEYDVIIYFQDTSPSILLPFY